MIKVYQAIMDKKLCASIYIEGREMRIEFSGGDSNTNGVYMTSDPLIQDAIENNPNYGKRYKLYKSIVPTSEKVAVVKEQPVNKASNKDLTFRTVYEAQQFFCKPPYNIPKTKLRTSHEVIEKGRENGFDVTFKKD